MKVYFFIIYVLLITFASNNQMGRDFILGFSYGVNGEAEEKKVGVECFDAEMDRYIEQVKMYLATKNTQALESLLKNYVVFMKLANCVTPEVMKIFESFGKMKLNIELLGLNLIPLEQQVVTFYKSETKNGRELGKMIGGIIKILNETCNNTTNTTID